MYDFLFFALFLLNLSFRDRGLIRIRLCVDCLEIQIGNEDIRKIMEVIKKNRERQER